jgi:creatinine amidohydrolase
MRSGKRVCPAMVLCAAVLCLAVSSPAEKAPAPGQGLPVQYEELTAPDFIKAVAASGHTCIIPLGIMEKHGPHMPLGTDLFEARELALRGARKEYTIVFPPYYIGQIFEARHQPGAIAYSVPTMLTVLQETCDELGRNGIQKIILVNGHGGNDSLVQYFCQSQLASRKGYAVYLFDPSDDSAVQAKIDKLRRTRNDGHAGEEETSEMLAIRPDLVHLDRAEEQSGADLRRLAGLKHAYTAIWWYAKYPNHYAGEGSAGRKEFGETILDLESGVLAEMIRSVKQDKVTLELQKEFFDGAEKPLETRQAVK